MYGAGAGSGGLGANYSQSQASQESIINNNSQLIANNNIFIDTSNDTTIKGANLRANFTIKSIL